MLRGATRDLHYAMIYHVYKDFLFRSYFVTPNEQLKQLKNACFSVIKAYALSTGKLVIDPTNMLDNWVYFLTVTK